MTNRFLATLPLAARLFVGLFFLVSAWAKLADIEGFAVQVLSYRLFVGGTVAMGVAWSVALLEGALGMALLAMSRPGHVLHAFAVALVVGFSALLAYAWIVLGLKDCGCFGTAATMTPQVSLLKNAVLVAALVVSWRDVAVAADIAPLRPNLHRALGAGFSLLILLSALPVAAYRKATDGEEGKSAVATNATASFGETSGPYARYVVRAPGGDVSLAKGEYFVALLSMSCEHCAESVPAINELHAAMGDGLLVVGLCLGDEASLEQFRAQNAPQFPLQLLPTMEFFDLIGSAPPRFALVRDGTATSVWEEKMPTLDEVLGALASPASPPPQQ